MEYKMISEQKLGLKPKCQLSKCHNHTKSKLHLCLYKKLLPQREAEEDKVNNSIYH